MLQKLLLGKEPYTNGRKLNLVYRGRDIELVERWVWIQGCLITFICELELYLRAGELLEVFLGYEGSVSVMPGFHVGVFAG